jgi:hypothetical protein
MGGVLKLCFSHRRLRRSQRLAVGNRRFDLRAPQPDECRIALPPGTGTESGAFRINGV